MIDLVLRHPGHPDPLTAGETILLIDRKGRRYLVTLVAEGTFHFHAGAVAHDDLIGRPEGVEVRSAKNASLTAVRPTAADWTVKAPRRAQVVYPKDQAMILSLADIGPGCCVVEAGAGSGALTAALLRSVGPTGTVISYERRAEHAEVAERSVAQRFGEVPSVWELRVTDLADSEAGLRTVVCDRLVLDLLEPWSHVEDASVALRPGGICLAYTPSVSQVMRFREAVADDPRWGLADTVETLLRRWHVDGLAVRPDHRMVAHTAFLTTVRRLADPDR